MQIAKGVIRQSRRLEEGDNTICSRSECEDVFLCKKKGVNVFMNITSNDKSCSLPNVFFSFSAV